MKIGMLGAGRMTKAMAPPWIAAGHDLMIAGRTPARAAEVGRRLGAESGTLREAAEFGDVVVLAVLYPGVDMTLELAGAAEGTLRDKIIIDCNNPVEVERFTLVEDFQPSLAEYVASATGGRVVKALNQVHCDVWERRATYGGEPLIVPIAGDDDDAKGVVGDLVGDVGGEPLDVGDLEQAGNVEAMTAVVIRLLARGADPLSAFQLTVGTPAPR